VLEIYASIGNFLNTLVHLFINPENLPDLENKQILNVLKETIALLELHEENPFKIRGYQNAVFRLEKVSYSLAGLTEIQLAELDGVGKNIAAKIREIVETGTFKVREELRAQTPAGLIELFQLPGVGTKKIRTLWKELGVIDKYSLQEAIEQDKVKKLKGFGEKSQETMRQSLMFMLSGEGKSLLHQAWHIYDLLETLLKSHLPEVKIAPTGQLRRNCEIIDQVEILTGHNNPAEVIDVLNQQEGIKQDIGCSGPFAWRGNATGKMEKIEVRIVEPEKFDHYQLYFTGSKDHLNAPLAENKTLMMKLKDFNGTESQFYQEAGLPLIPPELREGLFEFGFSDENLANHVSRKDIKGILHVHSTYSDGKNSIEELARKCLEAGYQYLGITDHSKSAFYANGLDENRIRQQHEEIDRLNEQLAPFRIFKGIESDILVDGNLDYDENFLAEFDFVIASVHSVLNMDIKKATERLLRAIHNPFTTILGHTTGRILLRRSGFPVDFDQVFNACAEKGVAVEINASPYRLDLDWRLIPKAVEKGLYLSINPDAHDLKGLQDIEFGIRVARKGGLTANNTLNTMDKDKIAAHFLNRRS
jgi:DNA polymerase (family 10)